MHQSVENIIDKLMGAVKADKPYYSLKDFLSAGFPSFIVERIRIEVNEKLKKEFELDQTDWANTDQELMPGKTSNKRSLQIQEFQKTSFMALPVRL
jgi:hypothetical protein